MTNSAQLQQLLNKLTLEQVQAERYRRSLREFTKAAWPTIEPGSEYTSGWHLDAISDHLEAVIDGSIKRLIINIPPRHSKSISTAVVLPAWTWATQPSKKFLYASYSASLSIRDSTKCRRLIDSPWYQAHFGDKFHLSGDMNQKSRFENSENGIRLSTSVAGSLTGEGGDCIVLDDVNNVVEADSQKVRQGVIDWWDQAMQSRLNDPKTGAFIVIQQRVNEQDLTGHILANELGNEWDHLVLPARYEIGHPTPVRSSLGFTDPRTEEGELLWPERFGEKELSTLERGLGSYAAAGQLQQRPSPKGGGILKSSWWVPWEKENLPDNIEYVIQSWDTAFETKESSSFSARTTWGVFKHQGYDCAIVLEAWYDKVSYPELRKLAQEAYDDWEPDAVLIEKKASGQSLLQDLRMAGVPVLAYSPDRDKEARAHAASALLEDGRIFYPKRKWAEDLISICAAFPAHPNDDIVDTCTQAWLRLRKGWFLGHTEDPDEDDHQEAQRITMYG
jgi:predicted phage terminase large subunit-like protein